MGRAAQERKPRYCPVCKTQLYTNSPEIKQHVDECERLAKIGLKRA